MDFHNNLFVPENPVGFYGWGILIDIDLPAFLDHTTLTFFGIRSQQAA
jgi:hypothetical protein